MANPRSFETIPDWFAHTVATAPSGHGLSFEGVHHGFPELEGDAAGLAAWLGARGIGKGDVVALCLPNRMEIPLTHLALMRLGAITLPLNTAYTGEEIAYILGDSAARAIVTDRAGAEALEALRGRLPALREVILVGGEPPEEAAPPPEETVPFPSLAEERRVARRGTPFAAAVGPEDVAMILYTSGTTGRPKGAQLTHRNITANLASVMGAWRITAADRFLLTLPLFHAHGLILGLHGTLFSGCLTLLRSRFDADDVLRELAEHHCTLYMGVPTHYFRFLRSPALDRQALRAMRLFTSGSAPLDAATWEAFRGRTGHAILERYGLTETLFDAGNPYDGERKPGTVGLPFPGVEIAIRDAEGRDLPRGEEGQIWVRGANVFKGYLNRPEATAEAIREGWFATGDLGRFRREDGYLEILGRSKDLIITGGYNVYPKEVEAVIGGMAGVEECAVVGRPSPEYGETVYAYVVPRAGIALSAEVILETARGSLARYKVPRTVEFVPALPRNAMGKVQKQELRKRLTPA